MATMTSMVGGPPCTLLPQRAAAASTASTSASLPDVALCLWRWPSRHEGLRRAAATSMSPSRNRRHAGLSSASLLSVQAVASSGGGGGGGSGGGGGGAGGGGEGFFGGILKKAQGGLPVIGLVNRLLSPSGGVGSDYLDYQAFCRGMYDTHGSAMVVLFEELEAAYTVRYADSRAILFCLWLAQTGSGVVDREEMQRGAKRLRVSRDLGFEVENFDVLLDEAYKKETNRKRVANLADAKRADVAVSLLNQCIAGNKMEKAPDTFAELISLAFPSVDGDVIDQLIDRYLPEDEGDAAAAKTGEP